MSAHKPERIRPDAKGRIPLGAKLTKGVSSYEKTVDKNGTIRLKPFMEIPAEEKWLYDNKKTMTSVRRGLKQSAKGQTKSLGKFSQYIDEDE